MTSTTTDDSTRSSKVSNQFLKNFGILAIFGFVLLSLGGGILLGAMHNDNRFTLGWGYIGQAISFFFGGSSPLVGVIVALAIIVSVKVGARVFKSGSNIVIAILVVVVLLLGIDRFWPNVLGVAFTGVLPLVLVMGVIALAALVFTPRKTRH